MSNWIAEGCGPPAPWNVDPCGLSVCLGHHDSYSFFIGDFDAMNVRTRTVIGGIPDRQDNDFFGFALGLEPGEVTGPQADYYVVAWHGPVHPTGLKLVRVTTDGRCPPVREFADNTGPVQLVAWAQNLGTQTWEYERDYVFDIALTPTNLRIWVDGVLEFDVDGAFPDGRFAFFTGWQPFVCYSAPEVNRDLANWVAEGCPPAPWNVDPSGLSVCQGHHDSYSCFIGDFDAMNVRTRTVIGGIPDRQDNDFFGFALGLEPGEMTGPQADYYVVVWHGPGHPTGLKLVRVTTDGRCPTVREFADNTGPVQLVAWAQNLGTQTWEYERDYVFDIALTPTNLRIWVDGVLEFDVDGAFPDGRFAFFTGWQPFVCYTAPEVRVLDLGDLNCDGAFNGADIDPFFLALGDPAAYCIQFPNCNIMNGDCRVNGADIDPFFVCLGSGGCP